MQPLTHTRCFNHHEREAVARCPECERCYCRECVTEHDDRVICARCLRGLADAAGAMRSPARGLGLALQLAAAFLFLWFVFYVAGRALLLMPTSFHEGTLWRELAWEVP